MTVILKELRLSNKNFIEDVYCSIIISTYVCDNINLKKLNKTIVNIINAFKCSLFAVIVKTHQ